jgi:integral membrane protein
VSSPTLSPRGLFRRVAIAEAVTWALLLTGMVLKYGTGTTELLVSVGGMLHGVVFIAYLLSTLLVAVDQRWSRGRLLLGLLAAVPPFLTVPFDRYAERRGLLGDAWRLRTAEPAGAAERLAAWLIRNPLRGAVTGVLAVLALTGVALLVGPPAG